MEKMKNKVYTKDYKKALIRYAIVVVVLMLCFGGTGYAVFGGRLANLSSTMEQQEKQQEKLQEERKDDEEKEGHYAREKISKQKIRDLLHLSTGDKVLIGTFVAFGILLFIWYWLLVIGLTMKTAFKLGINQVLFGWLAVFTNIGAFIVLIIYKHVGKVCEKCGKVQNRNTVYCSNCGTKLDCICASCGNHATKGDHFCRQCGEKL